MTSDKQMTDEEIGEWKAACVKAAENLELSVDDMWAHDDPYEMHDLANEAMVEGVDPTTFIEEIFEEDLARNEGDREDYRQSQEHSQEFDDEADFDTNDSEYG